MANVTKGTRKSSTMMKHNHCPESTTYYKKVSLHQQQTPSKASPIPPHTTPPPTLDTQPHIPTAAHSLRPTTKHNPLPRPSLRSLKLLPLSGKEFEGQQGQRRRWTPIQRKETKPGILEKEI